MSPKRRKKNKHLPPYVYFKHGSYFFCDKEHGYKYINLGKVQHEAIAKWAKLIDCPTRITNMNHLFDRYMTEVAPLKKLKTYRGYMQQIKYLRRVFGEMNPKDVTAVDIYKFLDNRGKHAAVAANREKSLLSSIFSMGIRWGIVKDNPCRDVKRLPEKPRDRYIEDWEYLAVRNMALKNIKYIMDFAYLTGQRLGDVLNIKLVNLTDEGIRIEQSKNGRKLLIEWSEELKTCVDNARKIFPFINIYLFCNRKGAPYTVDGFGSIWQRLIKKAISEGVLKEKFTFHDIRAKSSTDIKDRNHASALLGHSDIRITERVYNRKIKKVQPTR